MYICIHLYIYIYTYVRMYVHKYIHVSVYRRETLVDLVRTIHHHKLLLLHVSVDMSTDTSTLNPISSSTKSLHPSVQNPRIPSLKSKTREFR